MRGCQIRDGSKVWVRSSLMAAGAGVGLAAVEDNLLEPDAGSSAT